MDSYTNRCNLFKVSHLIGKKWTIPLIEEININKANGFNHLSKRLKKPSPKVLSTRLKDLEKIGLIKKSLLKNKITKTNYELTEKGKELSLIINLIKTWNTKHLFSTIF